MMSMDHLSLNYATNCVTDVSSSCSQTLCFQSPCRIEMVSRIPILLPRRCRCTWRTHLVLRSTAIVTSIVQGSFATCEQSSFPRCRDTVLEECTLCVDSDTGTDPGGMAASHTRSTASLHATTATDICWSNASTTTSASTNTSSTNSKALHLVQQQH